MLFEVKGIKEKNGEIKDIHFLFEADNPGTVRILLTEKNIIVLSIKTYEGKKEVFGQTFCIIDNKGKTIQVILPIEDVQQSCGLVVYLGYKILDANRFEKPLSAEEIKKIINETQEKVRRENDEKEHELKAQQQKHKEIYEDRELSKMQSMIDTLFKDIASLRVQAQGKVDSKKLTRLKDLDEELRKIRMGKNLTKIKETLGIIFILYDEIQDTLLNSYMDQQYPVIKGSIVTNLDIIDEYNKYKQSLIVKSIGVTPNKSDQYYIFLQKDGIFLKLLQADFLEFTSKIDLIFYKLFDIVELILITILVEFGIYMFVTTKILLAQIPEHVYIILIYLGMISLSTFVGRLLRPKSKSLFKLFICLLVVAALSFVGINLIILNFAI